MKKRKLKLTLPGLFSMQFARQPNLHPRYSPQPTDMNVARDAVACSLESISSKAHMGAVNTAIVTLANLMLKH